jgi:hypothetical protein
MQNAYPYKKLSITLLSDLQPRAQDVVARRFGLQGGAAQTLEAIGKDHGITRERVRQIIEDSLQSVREGMVDKKEKSTLSSVFQSFVHTLKGSGGLKREDLLVEALDKKNAASIAFLLALGEQFHKQKETEHFHAFWTIQKELLDRSAAIVEKLLNDLESRGESLTAEEIKDVHPSFLEVSKYIEQGHDGRWGLRAWPEVHPRGIKDRAYLVLKHTKQPLHFTQVAEGIRGLQQKKVLPQTVHNELIKDPRFVLVGRGTYALVDWGYEAGTVKDVLSNILQASKKAMDKEELIQKALEQRQVKESTILLNLQDKRVFSRDNQGRYYIMG